MEETGPKERNRLSKEDIIRAAREIVETDGLQAVSIRGVAQKLGVNPTAITWHVGSKRNLLVEISSIVFRDLRLADDRAMSTADWLVDTGIRFRQLMVDNANFAPLISGRLSSRPPTLPFVERVLRVLSDLGLSDDDLVMSYNAYMGILLGWVALEMGEEPAEPQKEVEKNYRAALHDAEPSLYTALTEHGPSILNRVFMLRWSNGIEAPMDASYQFLLRAAVDQICTVAETRPKTEQGFDAGA